MKSGDTTNSKTRTVTPTETIFPHWYTAVELRRLDGRKLLIPCWGELPALMMFSDIIFDVEGAPECWIAAAYLTREDVPGPVTEQVVVTSATLFTDGEHVLECEAGQEWIKARMDQLFGPGIAAALFKSKDDASIFQGRQAVGEGEQS